MGSLTINPLERNYSICSSKFLKGLMREKEGRRGKNKRKKRSKRLYKSTTNSVLCGVCGGIKKKHIGLIIVISLLFIAAEDLISWMRSYNETAPKGEGLRFYGFDMQ